MCTPPGLEKAMANQLPSNEALEEHYFGMGVEVELGDREDNGTGPYVSEFGSVTKTYVDGEGGVLLSVEVFIPTEKIPQSLVSVPDPEPLGEAPTKG
jgi:hypothetical protein